MPSYSAYILLKLLQTEILVNHNISGAVHQNMIMNFFERQLVLLISAQEEQWNPRLANPGYQPSVKQNYP